jgi:hypothetical protein
MLGTKTSIASLFAAASLSFAAASAFAATPDYFPLQTGNSWVYRASSRLAVNFPQTIDVDGVERFRDRDYYRVSVLGRDTHLRGTENGIAAFNTSAGQESTWLDFASPVGVSIPVSIEPCTRAAKIESREAKIKTPAGEWENALHVSFEPSCADAGLTNMYIVPGVGIVAYEASSIAGPVKYELIYTRTGSGVAEAPQTAFTVALDSPTYKAGERVDLLIRLTLRTTEPVTLTFPSGQRFDARVWNDKGQAVYSWSADKLFAAVFSTQRVGPGERTSAFVANVPNLGPGRYVLEAWLATQSREYVGTVGFEVLP